VFTQMRVSAPKDHFYFFALFTTADGSYVAGTGASEEGLLAVATRYAARRKSEVEVEARKLRFSAPDSPFHDFDSALLQVIAAPGLHEACFDALRVLDDEGFFGTGAARDSVIVNVVYGDMSDERWLAHARRLNDEASIARVLPYLRLKLPSGDVEEWGQGVYQANAVSLSRDRSRVGYCGSGGELGVLEVASRRSLFEKRVGRDHWCSVLAPDGGTMFVGTEAGVILLDVATGRTRPLFDGDKPSALALSPDGSRIAVATWGDALAMRDARTGAILWSSEHNGEIAFAPAGDALATLHGAKEGYVLALLDASTGRARWSSRFDDGMVTALALGPDGRTLVASATRPGAASTELRFVDASTGHVERSHTIESVVRAVAWSPRGDRVGICAKRTLIAIDLEGRELARGTGGHESLHACVFASDTKLLAVGRNVNVGPAILELNVPR
jgi:hypothetical protein